MKKIILIFVLIMPFISSFAQTNVYHPFPDSNAVWSETINGLGFRCISCCYGTCLATTDRQDFLGDDTIIGLFTYKKLFLSNIEEDYIDGPPNCLPGCNPIPLYYSYYNFYEGAIRQDTSLRRVFIVQSSTTKDTLLYDFNLNLGDTLKPSFINYAHQNYVSQIDSVLVGGNYHKRFWLTGGYVAIIEGIGSTFGLLSQLVAPFEFNYSLTCVSINSIPVFPDTITACAPLTLAIHENTNQFSVSIYPNPATDKLTIDVSATLNIPAIIEISNIEGQLLETLTTTGNKTNVDISVLAKGMYFVKVKTEKGVAVRKIIKE